MTGLDKLYFIVDAQGNYYRINKNNQLIVTKERNEADVFSFIEANKRIQSGKKSRFYSLIPVEEQEEETMEHTIEKDTYDNLELAKNPNYDLSQINWEEYLNNFCYVASSLKNYHDELNGALSDVDMKICDVMHYVELNDLSNGESIKAVALLKELREARRKIKDEMFKADNIHKGIGTNANIIKAKDSIKQIEKLEKRKYTPRKLAELFEEHNTNHEYQFTKEEKKEMNQVEAIRQEEEKTEMYLEPETIEMEYERRETIYDGKENDWMQFAKMQVEFFENAKQHIYNLEDDLDAIEDEIEEILLLTEEANYNVTQGYKVFKKLKDLRRERRKKLKELDCLDALTEQFNCEAMAEIYRKSVEIMQE